MPTRMLMGERIRCAGGGAKSWGRLGVGDPPYRAAKAAWPVGPLLLDLLQLMLDGHQLLLLLVADLAQGVGGRGGVVGEAGVGDEAGARRRVGLGGRLRQDLVELLRDEPGGFGLALEEPLFLFLGQVGGVR